MNALQVHDLGRMDYAQALERQRQWHSDVIAQREAKGPMHLLLLEHDPAVITVSRRPDAAKHVLASSEQLRTKGVQLVETDRGGDVTWHGPGQLVAYPILDLHRLDLRIHAYMRFLEQVVLDTLQNLGVHGLRDQHATGVWVGNGTAERKICAMGVRVSRWVTLHGLALNVCPDLEQFSLIVPCGLEGRAVTSLAQELGDSASLMEDAKRQLALHFTQAVECRLKQTGR